MRSWNAADGTPLRRHTWFDPQEDPEHDPPHEKQAYKLPHHEVIDGRVRVVWAGVRSAMQVHEQHYKEFDKEPPSFDEIRS